jgi:hypothetical protein
MVLSSFIIPFVITKEHVMYSEVPTPSEQEVIDQHSHQDAESERMNMEEVKKQVLQAWEDIVAHPEKLTDLSERKVVFVAGGGLPSRFGLPAGESEIWDELSQRAVDGAVEIAGVKFTLDELTLLGEFYRFLRDTKNMSLHCIDERLVDDVAHSSQEVHDKCGACAAVAAAAGIPGNIEGKLKQELHQELTQGVYEDMPDHESMTILVDYHGADVVLDKNREDLKEKKALPFNVSLPLHLISEWAETTGKDAQVLIPILTKWGVQIARNIIEGHHNTLHEAATDTIIVTDQRQVSKHPLLASAQAALNTVQHGHQLQIQ